MENVQRNFIFEKYKKMTQFAMRVFCFCFSIYLWAKMTFQFLYRIFVDLTKTSGTVYRQVHRVVLCGHAPPHVDILDTLRSCCTNIFFLT